MKYTLFTLRKIVVCLFLTLNLQLATLNCFSQCGWTSYDSTQALVNERIHDIFEDNAGNIWFGTDGGVTKFNGTTWTSYTITNSNLSNNNVYSIEQTQDGNMWFGTAGSGACEFDGSNWIIYNTTNGLVSNSIWDIEEDHAGNIWFAGASNGIVKKSGSNWHTYTTADGFGSNSNRVIKEDRHGNIWVGSNNGVTKFDGTHCINYTTANGLPCNTNFDIFEDHDGIMWFGMCAGAVKFNGIHMTIYTTANGLPSNSIQSITQDLSGNIWLASPSGAAKFDGTNFTIYNTNNGLHNNQIKSVLADSKGNIWFGSFYKGVTKYDGASWTWYSYVKNIIGNHVNRIYKDPHNQLWFATNSGVSKFKGTHWSQLCYYDGLVDNRVNDITFDKEDSVWFATQNGASENKNTFWANFYTSDGLPDISLNSIMCTHDSMIWIGTHHGAAKWNGYTFTTVNHNTNGLVCDSVNVIVEDPTYNLWFGTDKGISKFDGSTYTTIPGAINNHINDIIYDHANNLWFATDSGISKYNGATWTHYTTTEGLINNHVNCIKEDALHNIWFGTQNGVSKFDGAVWTTYTTADGLINNNVTDIEEMFQGILWFATNSGLSSYIVCTENVTVAHTDASCFGSADGSITITTDGTHPPYQYSINNGTSYQTGNIFTGLTAGVYNILVLDSGNNVAYIGTDTLHQPAPIVAIWDVTNISCFGQSDGAIHILVSAPNSPVTFLWNDGPTTQDRNNLASATYSVTITDSIGCQIEHSIFVDEPPVITLVYTQTNIVCSYDKGSINLTVSGGVQPCSFLWSNNAATEDIDSLTAGTYSVTATDYHGCTMDTSITITQPSLFLTVVPSITNISCHGQSNGEIHLALSGGVQPYALHWSNDSTTTDLTNLTAGNYSVTISDNQGCIFNQIYPVTQPDVLLISNINRTNIDCYGNSNGAVNITVTGGTTNYSYNWEFNGIPYSTSEDLANLAAGIYYITVTDTNNCTFSDSIHITQPPVLSLTQTLTDVTCLGGNDGAINLTVTGGTGIYIEYRWYNNADEIIGVAEDISGLTAGIYRITVKDNHNCMATDTFEIAEPAIQLSFVPTDLACNGANDGTVNLIVLNFTGPLTYHWSNGSTNEDLHEIPGGIYIVTVTYNTTCTLTDSVIISEPPLGYFSINSDHGPVLCSIETIHLNAGSGFTHYLWSTGDTVQNIMVTDIGTYTVIVADNNNCHFGDTISFSLLQEPSVQQICMVSVDSVLNKNIVIWEKEICLNIASYAIYRETETAGVYAQIGSVPYSNAGLYIDTSSHPELHADRYKISAVDTCGNESILSDLHGTVHLSVAAGIPTGFNIGWFDVYEGWDPVVYIIYRSINNGELFPLDTVSNMIVTYSDINVPPNAVSVCYMIGAVKPNPPCLVGFCAYDLSLSNIECMEVPNETGKFSFTEPEMKIYPNPFNEKTTVEFYNPGNSAYTLQITDITGKIMLEKNNITTDKIIIEKGDLTSGFYFIELHGKTNYKGKLIIK
ncbi:MAG: T9SS type A sorting domain-containing protein [Bacteroidia bacterium]|nr:T9SS type A sorting domain-containing protein [Bacteroidia bacterium]